MHICMDAIDEIVGCHQSPWIRFSDGNLEWLQIEFSKGSLLNYRVNCHTVCFLLVSNEMFDGCSDALALKSIDVFSGQFSSEERVFRERLEVSATKRRAMQAHGWCKQYVSTTCLSLLSKVLSNFSNEVEVPRCSKGDSTWE